MSAGREEARLRAQEIAEKLNRELILLCERMGIKSMVVEAEIGDRMGVALWLPGCTTECEDPGKCAAKNFESAGHSLLERADAILSGTVRVQQGSDENVKIAVDVPKKEFLN